jgi:hypothetical protein
VYERVFVVVLLNVALGFVIFNTLLLLHNAQGALSITDQTLSDVYWPGGCKLPRRQRSATNHHYMTLTTDLIKTHPAISMTRAIQAAIKHPSQWRHPWH